MLQGSNALFERCCIRRLSAYLAVLLALLLAIIAITPRAQAQTACNVVYTISPQNSSAFGAAITIQNTGTTALSSWTLTWSFANGQTVSSLWNGIETQSGANVTVKNEPYNGSIPANGSLSGIGFNGTWNGSANAVPASFAINGTTCGASLGSFKLAPSASSLTVALGASGTDTITVTDVSPFTGSVSFAATGLPTGVTASFSPASSTTSSVVTLAVAATTVAGSYPITITGTSGTLAPVTTTITLTVPPASGFTLTPTATALSIVQGGSGTDTITVKDTGTFTGSVTLAASGLPAGVTATFGTNPATTTSVLTFAVAASTVTGTYPITITGTSGTLGPVTTSIALTVTGLGGFTLSALPASLTVAPGASATDTITVADVSPFAGSVTFAASGLPTGVTAAFSPASSTSSSVVTFTAASTAAAGLSTVTITGTSGTLSATTTMALTVGGGNGACQVIYTISPQNSTAFGAAITIENTSSTALTSWTLTWSFANGQTVSSLWNGIETQSGANVTVKNESYNGSIPANGSATGIGFNGTWSGTNAVPTNFAINGTSCGGVGQGNFTLKPSAATLSVAAGASGTDTITVTDVSPFTGTVTFTASGMPTGVTAAFSPASSTTSSVLTLAVASTTAAGTYPITITGTSGTLTPVTTSITLTVTGQGGFTLAPSAPSLTIAPGASGTDTVTVTDISPFTGSVAFAASGLPTGVTATFTPTSSTTSSVVSFTVASTTVAGTYPITITGTSGTLSATTAITLTVTGGAPANATVTVNQSSTGPAISDTLLGMNMAAWYDVVTNETTIVDAFKTAGIKAIRWPGGSWSDLYHWQTNTNCDVSPYGTNAGQPTANDTFVNFVNDLAIPAGLDVALTADYGTDAACTGGGLPSEAAAWVAAALTDGITVSHMTVGNEVYGSTWEEDLHSPANNAATYAAAVVGSSGYYDLIKASSPNTLVGVVVDADNTGGGWDNTVLANAKGSYDFVEYHYYPEAPGSENDTTLVQQDAQELTTNINTIKSELTKWGTAGTPIYVGEMGSVYSNPGKQSWSITQGLFAAQELGEMMNDGISRATWWIGFDNCNGTAGNLSSSIYGWQDFGAYSIFSDGPADTTCPGNGAAGTLNPTAVAFELFSNLAVTGENVLTASVSGDTTDVVAYAATHSGGTALIVFNRNETTSETVSITLSGQTTAATATEITYDKAIYDLSGSPTEVFPDPSGTSTWAPPTNSTISSPTLPLTLTLAPWSMNVVIIH